MDKPGVSGVIPCVHPLIALKYVVKIFSLQSYLFIKYIYILGRGGVQGQGKGSG